jgi:hypothetical protein
MLLRVVCFPLLHQPRLDESVEEPLTRPGGLSPQGRQEFREVVRGEGELLGEVLACPGVILSADRPR